MVNRVIEAFIGPPQLEKECRLNDEDFFIIGIGDSIQGSDILEMSNEYRSKK